MNISRRALILVCALITTQAAARHFYQPHHPALTDITLQVPAGTLSVHTYSSTIFVQPMKHLLRMVFGAPLSALYFGKSDFRMSNMFANCLVPPIQNYSPYVRILKMQPRVQYHEIGTHLGITAYKETENRRARMGVRVDVPVIRRNSKITAVAETHHCKI